MIGLIIPHTPSQLSRRSRDAYVISITYVLMLVGKFAQAGIRGYSPDNELQDMPGEHVLKHRQLRVHQQAFSGSAQRNTM